MYFKRQVGSYRLLCFCYLIHLLTRNSRFFFKIELSTMYRTMEAKNYLTPEAAIEDLKEG